MSRYMPNAEDSQCFQEVAGGCSSKTGEAGIFAMIAKISLGLRKFRNHSKNFARDSEIRKFL